MEDINKVLGLGEAFSRFSDSKVRTIYPITMNKFQPFMKSFAMVNPNQLWMNYMYDESIQAVKDVMTLSFREEEDIDNLFEQITNENFMDIMKVIKAVNGFEDMESTDPNPKEV